MKKFFQNSRELIAETFKKAYSDDIVTHGAAIAFYTIFSIAPLFILIITLSGLFLSEETINAQITYQLDQLVGPELSENLTQFLTSSIPSSSGIIATVIASFFIIFGATTVISQLKLTLNNIWNIHVINLNSLWHYLLNRLLSFGMIIIFSLLLIFSLMTEGAIGLMSSLLISIFPGIELDFYRVLSQVTTIGFAIIFFTLIFKILPDVHAPWRDVVVGAVVTTVLFLIGKYMIGLYLSAAGIQSTYKAAGTMAIFVVWVYYNVQTILLGAVFTQVYTEKFGGQIHPYRFVELKERIDLTDEHSL